VFKARPPGSEERFVLTLSDDFLVRRCFDHWVVVGPSGLFVIVRSDGDAAACAQRAVDHAHVLRSRLADELPWVPFVSAVVVADGDRHDLACPVVDIDDLTPFVQHGGRQIGDGALQLLRHHVPGAVQQIELDQNASGIR